MLSIMTAKSAFIEVICANTELKTLTYPIPWCHLEIGLVIWRYNGVK
jgi:hypothetical protein